MLLKRTIEIPEKWVSATMYAYFDGPPSKNDWMDVFPDDKWEDIEDGIKLGENNPDTESKIIKLDKSNDKTLRPGVEVWSYGFYC